MGEIIEEWDFLKIRSVEDTPDLSGLPEDIRRRIEKLRDHPERGGLLIGSIKTSRRRLPVMSNCFGTVAYVLGISYETANGPDEVAEVEDPTIDERDKRLSIYFSPHFPGYFGSKPFRETLAKSFRKVETPKALDIMVEEYQARNPGLCHAAVVLRSDKNSNVVVEQNNHGGNFRIVEYTLERPWSAISFHRRKK